MRETLVRCGAKRTCDMHGMLESGTVAQNNTCTCKQNSTHFAQLALYQLEEGRADGEPCGTYPFAPPVVLRVLTHSTPAPSPHARPSTKPRSYNITNLAMIFTDL